MIRVRRHESGISSSRASRSSRAVSCFCFGLLTHFLAFPLVFLVRVSICPPFALSFCLSYRPSSFLFFPLILDFLQHVEESNKTLHSSSSFLHFSFFLLLFFSSLLRPCVLFLTLMFLYLLLFHAWPTARNRSYRDYVLYKSVYTISLALFETTLFFSLRDAVKSFLA